VTDDMTEEQIVAEINHIAALSASEMTLGYAMRSSSLRNALLVIRAARRPLPPAPEGN
jgi:hypothetical protein